MARIAVIIVNYNAADLSIQSLKSVIERDHGGHEVEIHLVDNASPEGCGPLLRHAIASHGWQGQVSLYLEETNHGFGRGNNLVLNKLAVSDAPPDYVFLLNPDASLRNDTIAILADHLETHPHAAIAGARSFNPGETTPAHTAFRFPSAASLFDNALNFGPVSRLFARHRVAIDPWLPTSQVDWVSGAGAMARFDVWRDLGFFDPEYFLYYEEVDLMRQTKAAGWEVWHVAEAEIEHVEGASTDVRTANAGRVRRPAYWYHSWQYYFAKNHGRAYALMAGCGWMAGAAGNLVIARLRGQLPRAPKNFFGDFWAHGMRPLLGFAPVPPGQDA